MVFTNLIKIDTKEALFLFYFFVSEETNSERIIRQACAIATLFELNCDAFENYYGTILDCKQLLSLERPTLASRVFCFYSVIFQLTSAKFRTFAYNSRTVGSSCMKF